MSFPLRIAYTQFKRHQAAKSSHPIACNAMVGNSGEETFIDSKALTLLSPVVEHDNSNNFSRSQDTLPPAYTAEKEKESQVTVRNVSVSGSESESSSSYDSDTESSAIHPLHRANPLTQPIAILPQYITSTPTTLTITEATFPHFNSNFTVTTPDHPASSPLLTIHRERPSLTGRQTISSPTNPTPLLTIRRARGQIPVSHTISDPMDSSIAEIQGNFSAPGRSRVTVIFTNACDGTPTKLEIHGAWRNRSAEIRDVESGDVLARMSSELFNLKNFVGGRRDYEVQVAAGVDVLLIVALVTALDARSG